MALHCIPCITHHFKVKGSHTNHFISALCPQEFCNKGTLTDAVDRGWFREKGSLFDVDFGIMLHTAKEIASAMAHLHSCNILHGDLTGGNVLLTSSDGDTGRPFMAKVRPHLPVWLGWWRPACLPRTHAVHMHTSMCCASVGAIA